MGKSKYRSNRKHERRRKHVLLNSDSKLDTRLWKPEDFDK